MRLADRTSHPTPESRTPAPLVCGCGGWDRVLLLVEPKSQELGPRAPREELEPGPGK